MASARAIATAGAGTLAADGDGQEVVAAVLKTFNTQKQPVTEVRERQLGDSSALLLIICMVLIGEWILRRRNGLS